MPHRLYSIESRKGGVGKTTVALNLASILVKKGPVLLLDCDITGTSIVDPAKNSSFWASATNVLTYVDEKGETKDINLIQYFLERFIKGEGNVRDFIRQGKLDKGKINVLGSSLYGKSKDAVVNTRWLLEELHSYWMVEFIQQIISEFEGLFPDSPVSIIIDNSPGYTTFSQALHNYMYDEGPQKAKYLLVSTLDSQDLLANIEAAAEIDKSIKNRTKAAKYFKSQEKDETGANRDSEVEAIIESDADIKDFFVHLIDNNQLLENYAKQYETSGFLALLLNKIPQSLKDDDDAIVDYRDIVGERYSLLSTITGSDGQNDPRNVVYYDEAIVYQYYFNYLRGKPQSRSLNVYWTKRFRELRQQAMEAKSLLPLAGMKKLNSSYEGLQTSLQNHGNSKIARQMSQSWAPNYAIGLLETQLSKLPSGGSFPSDISPQTIKEMLHQWNFVFIQTSRTNLGVPDDEAIALLDLVKYLESFAGLNDYERQPMQMVAVSLLLSFLFKSIELEKINEAVEQLSIREYLKRKRWTIYSSVIEDIKRGMVVNAELTLQGDRFILLINRVYRFVYPRFAYTIYRLLDQFEDFSFILDAVSLYVPSIPAKSLSKEMTDYITDVVYGKRKEHDKNRLIEIEANKYMMKNMQDVLRENVLKVWK